MRDYGVDREILKQVILESGIKFEQSGKSYVFTCPKCTGKRKLYIRKSDGRFVCWKCKETINYQGRPEYALADLLNQPVKVVQSRLYGGDAIPVTLYLETKLKDFFGDDDEMEEDIVEIPVIDWPCDYYPIEAAESKRGADYLRGRGIPMSLAKEYGIHYSPINRRVVFPISNQGKLYGWQERIVIPELHWVDENGEEREIRKILSSTGIPRERTLMFSDRLQGSEHAVLCEGPVDALKAHFCGGNVCAMGKAVSPGQMALLINGGIKKLYLALDPDAGDEMQRLMRNHFADVELFEMKARGDSGEKADLGAMDYEEVLDLFHGAKPIQAGHGFFYLKNHFAKR